MKPVKLRQSEVAKEVTKKRYLMTTRKGEPIETVEEMLWRVAQHIAKPEVLWSDNGELKEMAEKFYERMVKLKLVCSGKAMGEAGNLGTSGQLAACFVLPIEDSIDKIFKTLGEAAVVHKNNGGTGFNFSKIRMNKDRVKNVPRAATGPVGFIKAFSAALSQILQGSKRQGGNIAILNVDHPDIEEFIKIKENDGYLKNFNVSVGVSNEFMQAVEKKKQWRLINPRTKETVKTMRADKLFDLIVERAHKTGDPGMIFLDRIEEDNPTPTLGRIEATNPCITGEARVATGGGLVKLEELVADKQIKELVVDKRSVKNKGTELAQIKEGIYQGEKLVYELTTRAGFKVKATRNHRFLTNRGWKELKELKLGDEVLVQAGRGGFGRNDQLPFGWSNKIVGKNGRKYDFNLPLEWSQELGVFLGWMVGDGFMRLNEAESRGYVILSFGNKNVQAREYFLKLLGRWYKKVQIKRPTKRTWQIVVSSRFLAEYIKKLGVLAVESGKKQVPESIFTAPEAAVVGFLRGLFGADGTVGFVKNKSAYVRLTSKSKKLLEQVQLLLINMGIFSRIYDRSRPERKDQFPEYKTAKGEVRRYKADGMLWELEISKDSVLLFLDKIGFLFGQHKEKIKKLRAKKYYKSKFVDEVIGIVKVGKRKVYDLVEPKTRSFIANGLVVHNCGEIPLLPYESCNLTSIVLSNHLKRKDNQWEVDWEDLKKTIRLGVRFLDNMVEVNNYPLDEIEKMVKEGNRRIGLGVMGFAHMLYKLKIAYNSQEAVRLAEKLAKFIRQEADRMTEELGKKRGNFGNYDVSIYANSGVKRRNCATTMIAPTGTTSLFADCSSGIEPVFSLVTLRKTFFEDDKDNRPTRELIMVDPVFEDWLKQKFKNKQAREKVLAKIAAGGSLEEVKEVNLRERRVFCTTHEVGWQYHVKIQAAWQKYFDNSVSKTINFTREAKVEEVREAYIMAWKLGCKGITVYRDGSKNDQVLNTKKTSDGEVVCPECGGGLEKKEGCETCGECGFSKCSL